MDLNLSWTCLKDRAPDHDGRYLCYDGYEVNIAWYSMKHAMFFDGDGVVVFAPLRHIIDWMELPKPPQKEAVD
ncbi:MAG: DUF551 domain-containing protein [bacterium]|nr:DUF551 domain-containing protein [bacterium]